MYCSQLSVMVVLVELDMCRRRKWTEWRAKRCATSVPVSISSRLRIWRPSDLTEGQPLPSEDPKRIYSPLRRCDLSREMSKKSQQVC